MLSITSATSTLTIDLDSDEDTETEDTPRPINYPKPPTNIHTIHQPLSGYVPMWERKFAGSNRVERCRQRQLCHDAGEVLQSITAAPTLVHSSFEELRLECYLQSRIAKGGPPACAEPGKPLTSLPPMFHAFFDKQPGDSLDADMEASSTSQ